MKLQEVRNYKRIDWIDWESMKENETKERESMKSKEVQRLIKIKGGTK